MMNLAHRRILAMLPILAIALCTLAIPAHAATTVIVLRSGNALAGNPDPLVRRLDLATICGAGYATAFGAAEFAAADVAPQAIVIANPHPNWGTSIPCDPLAKWVGVDPNGTPLSALYAIDLNLPDPCCYTKATLDFCWLVDDALGDTVNPAGIYVNGTPIPAVAGGNYATQTTVNGIDILPLLHCGKNTIYVYDRDLGCVISGVNFSATVNLDDCIDPANSTSWGRLKATYR